MALLDWRNTPSEGMSTSPAQRLMGRRCKTLLPTAGTLLKPRHDTDADTRALAGRKRRQSFYYNQHARPLTPIDEGATVRMRLPGEKTWAPGTEYREGQLTKLSREGWRDGLQTHSTTVGVFWRRAPRWNEPIRCDITSRTWWYAAFVEWSLWAYGKPAVWYRHLVQP